MTGIFTTILNLSITASWLILAVLLVRFIFRKAPRGILCLLWLIVAVRLVIPFDLESALSLIPESEPIIEEMILDEEHVVPHNDSPEFVPDTPIYTPDESPAYQPNTPIIEDTPAYTAPTLDSIPQTPDTIPPVLSTESPDPVTALDIVAIVWFVGVAAMLIYCAISYIRVWRRVADSIPGEGNVRISERIASPFILGIIRPKIYLPSGVTGATAEYVIAHEKSHLKRMDHLIKPLGFLILSVYWFNPLVWIAYILLCRDIELACDERVLGKMDEEGRRAYAAALLECGAERKIITACPLAFGEVGVKERIMKALNYKKPMLWVIIAMVLAICVVTVCFLTNPISADENKENETETMTETESDSESETETTLVESESATETEQVTETEPATETESDTEAETEESVPETESAPAVTPEQPPVDTTAPPADTEPVTPAKPTTTTKPSNGTTKPSNSTTTKPSDTTATKPEKNYVTAENIEITYKGHFDVHSYFDDGKKLSDIASVAPTKENWSVPYIFLLESVDDVKQFSEYVSGSGVGEYGEDFFENNSLVVVYEYWGCVEDYVEFEEASFDGNTFKVSIVNTDYLYRGIRISYDLIQEDLWILEINGKFADDVKFEGETKYNPIYMDPNAHATQTEIKSVQSCVPKYYKDVAVDFDTKDADLREMSTQNASENTEVYVIETPKAAKIFCEKTKSLSNSPKTSLGSIISQYSDDYFEKKSLIVILQDTECVGCEFEITNLSYYYGVTGTISMTILPDSVGDAGTNVCVIEVEGRYPTHMSFNFESETDIVENLYYHTDREPISKNRLKINYKFETISYISDEQYENMVSFEGAVKSQEGYYKPLKLRIESYYELEALVKATTDSRGSPFEGLLNTYSKQYFENNSLILVLFTTPCSGGIYEFDRHIYTEDKIVIETQEIASGAMDAICHHLVIGEVNGVFSENIQVSFVCHRKD